MRNYFILSILLICFNTSKGQVLKNNDENIGIVYFSADEGNTWKNASVGLPQKVRIGLGGLAVSEKLLGVATKELGVYLFNLEDNIWVNIPIEKQIIDANIGGLIFYENAIYVATQNKGIFYTKDSGKTWLTQNIGLHNLTIRRFFEFANKLYVCTNDGFYLFDEISNNWKLEYGTSLLQVNGATVFNGHFYIATNQGLFTNIEGNNWKNVLPNHSVHNVSSDNDQIFAMTYNELLLTSNDGLNWQKAQDGLPPTLYTFNVLNQNNLLFAGQWDGVYKKTKLSYRWQQSSNGLPESFAATNLKVFNGVLVITTAERKLHKNMATEK